MSLRPLRIFVPHPSRLLTDHQPTGDGLIAHRFISELAARGHTLDVAADDVDLAAPMAPGVRIFCLGTASALSPTRRLRYGVMVRRLFDRLHAERPYDLIFQTNPGDVGRTVFLPARPVPIIIGPIPLAWPADVVDDQTAALKGPLVGGLMRRGRRTLRRHEHARASALLVFLPSGRQGLEVPGFEDGEGTPIVHVVPPGLDLDTFTPGEHRKRARTVLFVGRLDHPKGLRALMGAFDEILAVEPEVRLRIVGDGEDRDAVVTWQAASPHADRIELCGKLRRAQVAQAMREADVFCMPSLGEPFGMTALEAMACSRPVVVTSAGGLDDLVPDPTQKVPPDDAAALAATLLRLLRAGRAEREQIGRANRALAERYSWTASADRLEEGFERALLNASGGSV